MKNKISLFGEGVLSGLLYDENHKLLNYKSSSFFNKLSNKYEVVNYSRKSMNSKMLLDILKKLIALKIGFKCIVINVGENEAMSCNNNLSVFKEFKNNLSAAIKLCKANKIKVILIGLPYNDNNSDFKLFNEEIMYQALANGITYVNNSDVYYNVAYTLNGQNDIANNLFMAM